MPSTYQASPAELHCERFVELFPTAYVIVGKQLKSRYRVTEEEAIEAITSGIVLVLKRDRESSEAREIRDEKVSTETLNVLFKRAANQLKNGWRCRDRRRRVIHSSGVTAPNYYQDERHVLETRIDQFQHQAERLPAGLKTTLDVFCEVVAGDWYASYTPWIGADDSVVLSDLDLDYKAELKRRMKECAAILGISVLKLKRRVEEILRLCKSRSH